ncbi:hypothetical protein EC973_005205 [Apophysomyces ossiformis]|uniref:Uncharacterized protein n=1 Tax=Apophysomyces ossiformis TaxID=679940 RepID=A0A8H7BTI0_9FUNG|nr:hypothetical protein EC973_005205 [Apophysomyces ossiformis]
MKQFAADCYIAAHELVEFDVVSPTTVETLVLMHLYLMATGAEGEGRNLFCLAVRQLGMLERRKRSAMEKQDFQRLRHWMIRLDLREAINSRTAPIMQPKPSSMPTIEKTEGEDDDAWWTLQTEITGLRLVNSEYLDVEQLESWRESFSHKINGRTTLRLHSIYFTGRLKTHQADMMRALTPSDTKLQKQDWTDYFDQRIGENYNASVDDALQLSIQAALGLVQVIALLFQSNDRCMLPELMNVLSDACSALYFGGRMVTDPQLVQQAQSAIKFLVDIFESSASMMQLPRVFQFVEKWRQLHDSP